MMTLAELSPVASGLLPLGILKDQLRLPQGFANDSSFDGRLEQSLRSGLAMAEARTGKALFSRQFRWTFSEWGASGKTHFPIAPLVSLDAITVYHESGSNDALNQQDFTTIADVHKPVLLPRSGAFPALPRGASVEVLLTAGFGQSWEALPPDLREAVLIMAVDCFDGPSAEGNAPAPAVQALLQRYRALSFGGIGG